MTRETIDISNKHERYQFTAYVGNVFSEMGLLGEYERAINIIIKDLKSTKTRIDVVAHPVLFMMRHSLELGYKSNFEYLTPYSNRQTSKNLLECHDLQKLHTEFKVHFDTPDLNFDIAHFNYDPLTDTYTCPAERTLSTNGRWYTKNHGKYSNQVKHYKTSACGDCPLAARCTKSPNGRLIERSEHATLIDANRERIEKERELYRRRQSIVEHPFGTIKRQWDFSYIMTKRTKQRASADVGLIFTAYNLRRIFNILPQNLLKDYLSRLRLYFLIKIDLLKSIRSILTTSKISLTKYSPYFSVA